jgi:hypothetical protein
MSYQSLLTDRCDIYHLQSESNSIGYGVPVSHSGQRFFYADEPDAADVPCFFTETGRTNFITQGEPNNIVSRSFLVHFLPDVDIRVNDKIVWNGQAFKLQPPRKIRNHHWEVIAVQEDSL